MTTLTITEAKKNLGKWLNAAIHGEEIAIINGAAFVALRPVEVEAADYASREYGATKEELVRFEKRVSAEVRRLRARGGLVRVPEKLEEALEKIAGVGARRAKAAARSAGQRKGRRRSRPA